MTPTQKKRELTESPESDFPDSEVDVDRAHRGGMSEAGPEPKLRLPLPDVPRGSMFDSVESLYESARASISSFLKKFRKTKVRAARGSRKRAAISSLTTGRNTRIVPYVAGQTELAPIPSILSAMISGRCRPGMDRIRLSDDDFVGWRRLEYESLTLVLLVDVSSSTFPFIKVFQEILQSLADYFKRHEDRVGLISLQGAQARIYTHPTHNFRVVARGLSRLKIHGWTPLADGLNKSLQMARAERNKNPGARSVVILLSDCYPEPLTVGCRSVFDDPAYRNSITAASAYKRQRTSLVVINPAFYRGKARQPGEILSQKIADLSGGTLIRLQRHADHAKQPPTKQEINQLLSGVEKTLLHPDQRKDLLLN